MSVTKDRRMADRRLPITMASLLTLFVGLSGLYKVMQSPQFESYRTVDVVQLLGCGACFAGAIAGLVCVIVLSRLRNHHQNRTSSESREDK